jgi:hypothetical protein
MEVLPAWLGANRVLKLLNQPWEGDCTMVLPVTTFSTGGGLGGAVVGLVGGWGRTFPAVHAFLPCHLTFMLCLLCHAVQPRA